MQELASQSLELVNRELGATLETARGEIEDFVDGQSDAEALVRAASMLHLAAGALKIVEIQGAALVAEEMELVCRMIHQAGGKHSEESVEALTRAMVQLPVYLERLMSGGSDVALVLLPLLNDLRAARGQPLLSEGTLLLLNTGPFERLRRGGGGEAATREYGTEVPALAQRLRPKFQSSLLKWIRDDSAIENLDALIETSETLEKAAESEPVRELWAVTGGVLIGLRSGGLEPNVQIKRLLGQADRQLKRLIDYGEGSFVSTPPVELLNALLYCIARATGDEPRLDDLRKEFGIEQIIPDAGTIAQAREDLAGPSVRLMRTVAEAIKEDLAGVKDVLDIFVRTGMEKVDDLQPQLDMLKKIGDTLGVLGLDAAREKIQAETALLSKILSDEQLADASMLEGIAASLLDVEDMLERTLVSASDEESNESSQFRHVTQAVMRECIVNLSRIKEVVVKVLDDPNSASALDQVGSQLRGIIAGLLMLNRNRAVNVVERIGRNVTTQLTPGGEGVKPNVIERLADAIVAIEYYMETIALGRADPFYMLDNANRCLDKVEAAARASIPVPEPEPEPEPAEEEPAALDDTQFVPAPDINLIEELEATQLSVMEIDDERAEPELVEVFIEEAKEELASIRNQLPRWIEHNDDEEALIAIRRSFHTLKGSGRVVGAQVLGEFAWSIENLLNRVINKTLKLTPEITGIAQESTEALRELIEQLEIGIKPAHDTNAMMARAHALAEGKLDIELGEEFAARLDEDEDPEAIAPEMDPVLRGIFVKEVQQHLQVIREFVSSAAVATPPFVVTEPLHRACHTLFGSARMANCAPAIALAEPLDQRIRHAFEMQAGLSDSGVATLNRFCAEIEYLTSALENGDALKVDETFAAEISAIELTDEATSIAETSLTEMPDTLEPAAEEALAGEVAAEEQLAQEPVPEEPEDYDPEIAAIFCEEASELLELAEQQMQALRGEGDSDAAQAELKRILHTLKGGARLAGIAAMGDLSHALETMLPRIAEAEGDAGKAGMRLAQQSIDTLQQMRDAVDSGHMALSAAELVDRLERFGEEPAFAEAPAEAEAEVEVAPEVQEAAVAETEPAPEVEAEPVAEADAEVEAVAESEPEPEAAAEPDAEPEPEAPAPAPQPLPAAASATAAARADVTRVDAGVLDELLNSAGEISIFQSRLNQQIHSIDFHLGELGQTVTRLREQLRSLEAETEAQILNRHQGEFQEDEHFDPLELDRYSTIQQLSRALAETSNDVASINELLHGLTSEADTLLTQQSRVTTDIQDGLMQTRMVAFDRHASRLSRIVRQAAMDCGKPAELHIEGAGSQLDRQILEAIVPALEHILRNAVVHGIEDAAARAKAGKPEAGRISLSVRRDGAEVLIEAADDGGGLDIAAIRRKAAEKGLIKIDDMIGDDDIVELILLPGFSTAGELTQTAGRGVGMDVVDNEVKRLGGSLRIMTETGRGTRFLIRLPYTLAITHALVVNVGEETFALPLPTVEGIARVRREQLLDILTEDEPSLAHGEGSYRVLHLGSLVGAAPSALPEDEGSVSLVLVRAGDNSAALLTDSLEGSREIVVKTLGPHIASVPGVTGATILGDGRVVVILDAGTLVRAQPAEAQPKAPAAPAAESDELTALVVDDSITMRRVTQRLLEKRGVKVLTARDGLDAIEVLREHEADIILLDIEMPRMDGYQFATHVRNDNKLKDTPIIMVTSRSGEKHRARAIEIGVNDYLSKPYREPELVAAIEALVGKSL